MGDPDLTDTDKFLRLREVFQKHVCAGKSINWYFAFQMVINTRFYKIQGGGENIHNSHNHERPIS